LLNNNFETYEKKNGIYFLKLLRTLYKLVAESIDLPLNVIFHNKVIR